MRIRILLAVAAVVTLGACSESSTAPQQMRPNQRSADDEITCRSGYHVATRLDGTQYCEEDAGSMMAPADTL